jgi:hypothetical protein
MRGLSGSAALRRTDRSRAHRLGDATAKLAAKREQDLRPVETNGHVDGDGSRQQHEGEEYRGSQVSHRLIPFFIHSRTMQLGF